MQQWVSILSIRRELSPPRGEVGGGDCTKWEGGKGNRFDADFIPSGKAKGESRKWVRFDTSFISQTQHRLQNNFAQRNPFACFATLRALREKIERSETMPSGKAKGGRRKWARFDADFISRTHLYAIKKNAD
jgi:hypothetical protein